MSVSEEDFYYDEKGNLIFREHFLLKRGFCCGNYCRHCPYGEEIRCAASGKRLEKKLNRPIA